MTLGSLKIFWTARHTYWSSKIGKKWLTNRFVFFIFFYNLDGEHFWWHIRSYLFWTADFSRIVMVRVHHYYSIYWLHRIVAVGVRKMKKMCLSLANNTKSLMNVLIATISKYDINTKFHKNKNWKENKYIYLSRWSLIRDTLEN